MMLDEKFSDVKKLSMNTFPLQIDRVDRSTGIVS